MIVNIIILLCIIFNLESRKSIFDVLFKKNQDIEIQTIHDAEHVSAVPKAPILNQAFDSLYIPIRVLLAEKRDDITWDVEVPGGVTIFIDTGAGRYGYKQINKDNIIFTKNSSGVFVNNLPITSNKIFLIPNSFVKDSKTPLTFTYDSVGYDGICVIVYNEFHKSWNLINYLDLEDYVASVIFGESWPGWPDEVNRALSICYRTYGVNKLFEKKKLPYDIKNNNTHQVYKGKLKSDKFKKIVESTQHTVVSWQDKPILAMFDISCGNIVPVKKLGLDFDKAPYLGRTYACNYCKSYVHNKWEVGYSLEELNKIINTELNMPGKLRDIIVSKKDKSGCVTELKASLNYKWEIISAKQIKNILKKLRSINFSIKKVKSNLVFTGKGYGHLMGLCQRGAHQMVLQGYNYQEVLKFYYPKTELKKLSK